MEVGDGVVFQLGSGEVGSGSIVEIVDDERVLVSFASRSGEIRSVVPRDRFIRLDTAKWLVERT